MKPLPFRKGDTSDYPAFIQSVGLGQEPQETTMAKISKDLNNNITGRIGNVVYYQRNGKTFVRSLPSKYTDKESDKQRMNRKRFSHVGKLFQIFRPALRYDLPKGVFNKSCLFYSLNSSFVTATLDNVSIEYDKLVLSNTVFKELLGLQVITSQDKVTFGWELDNLQDDSYYVLCVVYAKGLQQVYVADVKRKELSATVNLPDGAGDIITYTIAHRRTA
jgi:hypothetical protein